MDIIQALGNSKWMAFIRRWDLVNFLLGALDILSITLAFQVAYHINYSENSSLFFTDNKFLLFYLLILPSWLLILYLTKNTEIHRTKRYREMFFEYLQSAIVLWIIPVLFFIIFRIKFVSAVFQIEFVLMGFILLFGVRLMEYKVFKAYRTKGYNQLNVVLIADDSAIEFIELLSSKKEWGYRIVAIFTRSACLYKKYEKSVVMLQEENLSVLYDLIEGKIVDEVLYIKSKIITSEVRNVISSCEELGIIFRLKSDIKKTSINNAVKTKIANVTFLNFINIPNKPYALALKKVMDINISLVMLITLSWVFAIVTILIKLTSPGPVIYKQARVGLRGRIFNLYKFRTMVYNAELLRAGLDSENEVDGPVFKIKNDPRITKIGRFLRKSGLDELPQLFNIMKGEMSLIGPRPPLESETLQYKRWQLRRLSVKPGLSCFWQIKPDRNNIKFENWMELDLAYIDNWSLRLDIFIFFKTIKTVFQRSGS